MKRAMFCLGGGVGEFGSRGECAQRRRFRVVHYSIQDDHAHFLVEAQGKVCLANGMKSLAAGFARCVNPFSVGWGGSWRKPGP